MRRRRGRVWVQLFAFDLADNPQTDDITKYLEFTSEEFNKLAPNTSPIVEGHWG